MHLQQAQFKIYNRQLVLQLFIKERKVANNHLTEILIKINLKKALKSNSTFLKNLSVWELTNIIKN